MADVPTEAPEHCPGTKSETAGKVSACKGCPNQTICASGAAQGPDPSIALVQSRMADVKHKILILSGKGGVGKSTFTSMLARGLAASDINTNVAVLDIDICGPSMPRMLGVADEQVHQSGSGWSPVYVEENLSVMSVGFLLSSPDDAIIWRGPKKNGMIKQFLSQVDWTGMDYMVLDTPPGTSDEHLSAVQFLSGCGLTGAVVVSTPQEVSLLDVRKEVDACHKLGVTVLGVVENMAGFVCPHCKTESQIFPANTGGVRQLAVDMNVPFLGSLPLDPLLARACDQGEAPDIQGPAWQAFQSILKKIMQTCEE